MGGGGGMSHVTPAHMFTFSRSLISFVYSFFLWHFFGSLIIIKCFEHQFIPKQRIDRHSVHLHACVVILELQSGLRLDICVTSQSCNKRACNKQVCNKRLYDEVWQFYRGI